MQTKIPYLLSGKPIEEKKRAKTILTKDCVRVTIAYHMVIP